MKEAVCEHDPFLRSPWSESTFPAAEFFLGDEESPPRLDDLDAIWGWRALTALGDYNARWGGELVLWDEKKLFKFPAGATFLFPSSLVRYSFTQIREGESRYAVSQYAQAGLYRYVENDFLSEANFEAISWRAQRLRRNGIRDARLATALDMYSLVNDFVVE
ncbi:hypothetical protein C8R46DRAFT_896445 [Mycena filopes]|nr:hypothetical protein C8R46DRAFT_896445 [Mycena filopes]